MEWRTARYDDDIYAWAHEQATLLRTLREASPDLPNALDLDNVAEEIEALGRSELAGAESFIRLILVHLIKIGSVPGARTQRKWRNEVLIFHADLRKRLSPAMSAQVDIDDLWRVAVLQAEGDLDEHGDELMRGLPARSPLRLAEFVEGQSFDVEGAVSRLLAASDKLKG